MYIYVTIFIYIYLSYKYINTIYIYILLLSFIEYIYICINIYLYMIVLVYHPLLSTRHHQQIINNWISHSVVGCSCTGKSPATRRAGQVHMDCFLPATRQRPTTSQNTISSNKRTSCKATNLMTPRSTTEAG